MESTDKLLSDLSRIFEQAKSAGLSDEEIKQCLRDEGLLQPPSAHAADQDKDIIYQKLSEKAWNILNILIFKVYPIVILCALFAYPLFKLYNGSPCLVTEVFPFSEAVIPFSDCRMCEGVVEAPRLVNLSQEDFIRRYAYKSKPIVVVGAANDWPALDTFSYDYFKDLYTGMPGSLEGDNTQGQFFAYSSDIKDLEDLFELPSEVATMSKERWYIGW